MSWDRNVERRRYPRAKIRLEMSFDEEGREADDSPICLETIDFSAGGFYCHINRRIEPLTLLGLRFVFPAYGPDQAAEYTIDCQAVVVRAERDRSRESGYRIAAHMTRISAEDRDYIARYVTWHNEVFQRPAWFSEELGDEETEAA